MIKLTSLYTRWNSVDPFNLLSNVVWMHMKNELKLLDASIMMYTSGIASPVFTGMLPTVKICRVCVCVCVCVCVHVPI